LETYKEGKKAILLAEITITGGEEEHDGKSLKV